MSFHDLLSTKTVLTHEDVVKALGAEDAPRRRTKDSLLRHYQQTGRLVNVRRGLYAVVPPGASPETCPVDPCLLAAKAARDAVLAYHTALEFHGKAYSTFRHFYYLSSKQQKPWSFRDYKFHRVAFPKALDCEEKKHYGVKHADRTGEDVRVTSLERTLVDVLRRPDFSGGWEEVWRSLGSVEFYDLDRVVEYVLLLKNATAVAKVGFFLEQHREELMVGESHLTALRGSRPEQPRYLDWNAKKDSRYVPQWNLMVPRQVLERTWEEVQ